MSQRYASVDLFRSLGAITILLIHSIYAGDLPVLPLMGRWAVPFFLMISGYFFQQNFCKHSTRAFAKTIKSLLLVYISANLFYVLFILLTESSLTKLATYFTLVVGAYFHLWFLSSLLLGYFVLWILLAAHWQAVLPYVAILLLVLMKCKTR